jgi:hypothetical protein
MPDNLLKTVDPICDSYGKFLEAGIRCIRPNCGGVKIAENLI